MHVKNLRVQTFKGFADLTISLEKTPRLVVLCGENGTGKSSVADALGRWRLESGWGIADPAFFAPGGDVSLGPGTVSVEFHEPTEPQGDRRSLVYVRTAQRVTVEFEATPVRGRRELLALQGPARSIDIDDRIDEDYAQLVAGSVEALWDPARADTPAGEIVGEIVRDIQDPLARLLDLRFDGPDSPFSRDATLRFSRDPFQSYAYKNLSGGEKAVFDLLLDIIVKRGVFGQAIWFIDEPELHVNPKIQGELLHELQPLLSDEAQLWIATNSPGMLAEARRQHEEDPGSVAFLDFNGLDRTTPATLLPTNADRPFWQSQLKVAIGDLAELIAPEKVVLCEGNPDKRDRPSARWDARVLKTVFEDEFPAAAFVSVGNADDVVGDRMEIAATIEALVNGVETLRVIDRDGRSETEIEDLRQLGCRVLSRRQLEAYLLDTEVIDALCDAKGKPGLKADVQAALSAALAQSTGRGKPDDDYKAASGHFVPEVKRLLGIRAGGDSTPAFMRDTLAPLLRSGMNTYAELREDIFGSP